eukprot:scaffold173265_cov31-Tisochrysis_lutea.AAC.1
MFDGLKLDPPCRSLTRSCSTSVEQLSSYLVHLNEHWLSMHDRPLDKWKYYSVADLYCSKAHDDIITVT